MFQTIEANRQQLALVVNELRRWLVDGYSATEIERVIQVLREVIGSRPTQPGVIEIVDPRSNLSQFGTEDPATMTAAELRGQAAYLRASDHEADAKAYESAADIVASVEAMEAGGAEVTVIDGEKGVDDRPQ